MPLMWDWNRPALTWSVSPAVELEVDPLAARQRAHEVGEEPGRHGRRAVRLDLAGHPVGDADLEVRRRQLQPAVLGPEQDVGQHRQRAPAGDRATDDRQAAGQVLLHDRELHVGCTPFDERRAPRADAGSDGRGRAGLAIDPRRGMGRGYLRSIFSLRHHRHHGVERWTAVLVGRATAAVDERPATGGRWTRRSAADASGRTVDEQRRRPSTTRRSTAGSGRVDRTALARMSTPPHGVVHRPAATDPTGWRPRVPTVATDRGAVRRRTGLSRRRSARGRRRSRGAARRCRRPRG